MITNPSTTRPPASDPRLRAGAHAERHMAHSPRRRFAEDPDIRVLHDLHRYPDALPAATRSAMTTAAFRRR